MKIVVYICLAILLLSCNSDKHPQPITSPPSPKTLMKKKITPEKRDGWTQITASSGIQVDIRYATTDNFTKKQIYPCGECWLRDEVAQKILRIHHDIKKRYSVGLKLYDCYRPSPAQQKLWNAVPGKRYVTPPDKGSMHNKGLAVDVTLVNEAGDEIDMGTGYDHFGIEAYHSYDNLPDDVASYRSFLKKLMELHGFTSIMTEWWHYSFPLKGRPLEKWEWLCE